MVSAVDIKQRENYRKKTLNVDAKFQGFVKDRTPLRERILLNTFRYVITKRLLPVFINNPLRNPLMFNFPYSWQYRLVNRPSFAFSTQCLCNISYSGKRVAPFSG